MQVNTTQLTEIATLIGEECVRVAYEAVLSLLEARKAHEIAKASHALGKVILRIVA
ncbi:zinc-binding dehydrogenase [Ktedonospora formicarum]|uniref:Uncharacterized protein n=1 Tax=Ktedonospora formicarum TaxID=2778364 RepID=A0A8J3MW15_9CHLR|nr:zinc-binding dehydrogenase [Ktedonospora formicarum]GHO47060.1 hypothetical protein KSX_52230 [Ktedonospora formicarum]